MTIGQVIVKLRKENGLTQEQLAEKLYVSRQAISKWENGTALPDLDNIRALSEFFGVSTDRFLKPTTDAEMPTIEESQNQDEVQNTNPDSPLVSIVEKKRRSLSPLQWIVLISVTMIILLFGCLGIAILLEHFGFLMLYDWMLPVTATVLTLIGGITSACICLKKKRGLPVFILAMIVSIVLTVVMWCQFYMNTKQFTRYVTQAPNKEQTILLQQDKESGVTTYYRRRFSIIMKKVNELPYRMEQSPKFQWTVDDVCAITYVGKEDGTMHQYVATFGDRGGGSSYYYVLSALYGNWSGAEEGSKDWRIIVTDGRDGRLILKVGNQTEESYTYEDCVQFGTTALVLCRGGLPRWTITLNDDCTIEAGSNLVAAGGTITLTQVSMSETPNYLFRCDDDEEKQANSKNQTILDTPEGQVEREIVSSMQRLADRNYISEEELPEGASLIDSPDENIAWMLFLHFTETDDAYMGTSGVDRWEQWDSVKQLAGDQSDSCWMITKTEVYTSPGNQGASPESETIQSSFYVRLVKAASGDYMIMTSSNDLSFGLTPAASEEIDVSENDAFHRFTPADFSGDNWKYMNVTRLSPEEAAEWLYSTEMADQYPQATGLQNNARPGYLLDPETGIYMIYDGIWQNSTGWVYRFWVYQASALSITDWHAKVDTIDFYEVDFYAYEK